MAEVESTPIAGAPALPAPEGRDDLVQRVRNALEQHATDPGWSQSRDDWLDDVKFLADVDDSQWEPGVAAARRDAGRPALTINKSRKFVNSVTGSWRENKASIKVRPVDDKADPEGARLREGLIRSIEYASNADSVYQGGLEDAASGGFGWARVTIEPAEDGWDSEIRIRRVYNPLSVYPDPLSREPDLSDARYVAITEMVPRETFLTKFPNAAPVDVDFVQGDQRVLSWYDSAMDMVRIAEFWWREDFTRRLILVQDARGQLATLDLDEEIRRDPEFVRFLDASRAIVRVKDVPSSRIRYALVSGAELLWGPKDWPIKWFPFVPFFGESSVVDGSRYFSSVIRPAKDAARAYNLYRSYIQEILSLQPKVPWIGPEGFMGEGAERTAWENSHKATTGALEYHTSTPPTRPAPPSWPEGLGREGATLTQDLKEATGIYDASLGAQGNEQSGKAILARQKQGATATSAYPDNARYAVGYCGRIIGELLPYVYDTPRIVRILGEDGLKVDLAAINGAQLLGPDGKPIQAHDMNAGKYDFVTTSGPSYVTRRSEAFDALNEMGRNLGPQVFLGISDIVARYGDFPAAEELAERLKGLSGGGVNPQVMQAVQQMVAQMITQTMPSPESLQKMIQDTVVRVLHGSAAPSSPRPEPVASGPNLGPFRPSVVQ